MDHFPAIPCIGLRLRNDAGKQKSPPAIDSNATEASQAVANLNLSVAIGDYDRNRPLIDGAIRIDGVDPVFMTLSPEEIFFRAFRSADFDVCELSLSSYTVKTALGECPYVGVPAFVSTRISAYLDLCTYRPHQGAERPQGQKVGVPEYQLTANVWARAILEDDFGVQPADIHWIRGGIEEPGRPEKISVKLPPGVRLDDAPEGETISALLDRGEIDGFIAPRPPRIHRTRASGCRLALSRPCRRGEGLVPANRNFPDHASDRRPPHARRHPSVAAGRRVQGVRTVEGYGARCIERHLGHQGDAALRRGDAKSVRELMGNDFWSYGVEPNRKTLEFFLRHHHSQGLSPRQITVEEMFHPSVYETFKL